MSHNQADSPTELGIFEKIINVFFEPRKTFESIDRKPDWIIPIAIVVIITIVFTALIMPISLPEQLEKQKAKMEEKGMNPQEIERAMVLGEKIGKIVGPISAGIVTFIILFAIAGIFMFTGNIVLGGKASYKKLLSVVSYSSLIGSLGAIVLLPIILSKKTAEVHFSLAAFLSGDASETFLYQLLKKIDLFAIWEIIAAGIGVAVVYKFTTKKSIAMVSSLYAIYIVIALTLRSLF